MSDIDNNIRNNGKADVVPRKKRIKQLIIAVCVILFLLLTLEFILFYNGVVQLNNPNREQYPVRGVNITQGHGNVEWSVLAEQNIRYAYIEATSGDNSVDEKFAENISEACNTQLYIGASHIFTFDCDGANQALHFINTIGSQGQDLLPPCIKVTLYGKYEDSQPPKYDVVRELTAMLDILTEEYGRKPILYVNESVYKSYISGEFEDYEIWVRNIVTTPHLDDDKDWHMWLYTNRKRLSGYRGTEKFVELTVFNGNLQDFIEWVD